MSPQAAVRAQARDALRHRYAAALLGFTVLILAYSVVEGISTTLVYLFYSLYGNEDLFGLPISIFVWPVMIVAAVLLSPLFNGYIRMFYRNAIYNRMEPADLFYYMDGDRYIRALRLNLSYILRMLFPGVLFFVPVFIYMAVCRSMDNDFYNSVLYRDFLFILCILSAILVTLYSTRYFLAFTLYVQNDRLSNKEIFGMTRLIMRAHRASAAKLIFSYTPWMLLCLTVLPMIYVVPYMTQGLCIGAKWMSRTFDDWMNVPPELREVMYESITMYDRV